jgi:hypothetical protein
MLIALFYKGLKDGVKDDNVRREQPKNLQAIISTAIKINNHLFEHSLKRKGYYNLE